MRYVLSLIAAFIVLSLLPNEADAAPSSLMLRHKHFLFTVPYRDIASWQSSAPQWLYDGKPVLPPAHLLVDGDILPEIPPGFSQEMATSWDRDAIRASLTRIVADTLERPAGNVTIKRTSTGGIVFEGVGFPGRFVDWEKAVSLTIKALEENVSDITLPIVETPPTVVVEDSALRSQGIRELVTVGESDFSGSPVNRRHNIKVGLSKFNGHLIPAGTTFSFNEILGRVDGSTGYRQELVIKGDRTEPDYGGGLCQVSTTAYRGVWEYGFPIEQRTNHSYAVSYYGPQGTDATVFPPNPDMKFKNDSKGAVLIQTHQENDKAYFLYYGTKDARSADVLGPFISGTQAPPPDRTVYTTELPPGVKKKLGERHAGMHVSWYRIVRPTEGEDITERVYSIYQARPLFYEVGVATLPEETGGETNETITEDELNAPEEPRNF